MMGWKVTFHPLVKNDLEALGRPEARRILKVIAERLQLGEPDIVGKPLHGALAGFRHLRTGNLRIVYRVDGALVEVFVIAVGLRRDAEVYAASTSRAGKE